MRILHTSDWHLGNHFHGTSRLEEQALFLDWMVEHLEEQEIDVLLLAGDVFHVPNPPAEAQALYYNFLSRASQTGLRSIVIIGGNHDSAARLDAASEILQNLSVHVVGAYTRDKQDQCLHIVRNTNGVPLLSIVAFPFTHEYRLGVRFQTDGDDARKEIARAFREVYQELADEAKQQAPSAPLVCMGHMACEGAEEGDFDTDIHRSFSNVGGVSGLPSSIFPEEAAYVALGHIHRMYPVGPNHVRYSGTPIAYNIKEARTQRYVLQVVLNGEEPANIKKIEVPTWRQIHHIEGDEATVTRELTALRHDDDSKLTPLASVEVLVKGKTYDPQLFKRLRDALEGVDVNERVAVVDMTQRLVSDEAEVQSASAAPTYLNVSHLSPRQVFEQLLRKMGHTDEAADQLRETFEYALTQLGSADAQKAAGNQESRQGKEV